MDEEQAVPRADGAANGGSARAAETRDGNDPTEVTDLEGELEELRARAQTYLDLAQRTQADFVNYRRRIEQERSDFARSTRADVIRKFLGPLDDLERALDALPPDVRDSSWAQGIEIVDRKFVQLLDSLGVQRVDPIGKAFDPHQEEAVAHEPSDAYPEGVVSKVVQSGYTIDGRVLRPALVVVSSGRTSAAG